MDEEIERLVVSVRADTAGFARDVAAMQTSLEGPFAGGVERAGRALETTLVRAVRSGRLGFEDLGRIANQVLGEIAASAMRSGLDTLLGGAASGDGLLTTLVGLVSGAPGRATGGPVSPQRPYWVGERGPELFVPTSSGSIATAQPAGGREVRVSIAVNAAAGEAPRALAQSSRQVARAVKAALSDID
ncbi:tail tape measure protein [Sphingomonas sp. ac-8]|uniref:tail tape measure protein n=1 Tax=Sphingomonas sp. ac-8 TaxID=3242977 RepID=UPI003A7FA9CA